MRLGVRLYAEFLGALLLMAAVAGSGVMAETLAAGNAAVALLANTFATVCILAVLILGLAPVSGAHFNPAVSLVMWRRGDLPGKMLAPYAAAQTAGAICGVWLAHLMFALPVLQLSDHDRSGPAQALSEAVATFGLVLTILTVSARRSPAVPYAVAAYIGAAYWFTASTSFANPAVTIARSLTDTFSGIRPADAPLFIAAQLAGALLALAAAKPLTKDAANQL